MKVALTLLVRDEIDIIRSMLDYHLAQGVDLIIVTDNGSVDGTYEALVEYETRGLMRLLREPPSDYSQHRWVTRMARLAYDRYGADWVINADADEFFAWRPGSLRQALESAPPTVQVLRARRHDFVPFRRPAVEQPPCEMVYVKAESLNLTGLPLPPKTIHRGDPDVVISQGNHAATSPRFSDGVAWGEIEVFHYPIRSLAQFRSKVRNGGSGYARNQELDANIGFHTRYWYELLSRGELEVEYWRNLFFDDEKLRVALDRGELLEDRTVANRLKANAGEAARRSKGPAT